GALGAYREPVDDALEAATLLADRLQQLLVVCGGARVDHEAGAGVTRKQLAGPDRHHDVALPTQALDHAFPEAALVDEVEPPTAGVPAVGPLHGFGREGGPPARDAEPVGRLLLGRGRMGGRLWVGIDPVTLPFE